MQASMSSSKQVSAAPFSSDHATDQQLVKCAQHGDKRAFDLLVIKYQRKLSRLISRFIHDASDVEDVTQEAFTKAYRALPKFRGDSAFYTWLYRIGTNTAKNYIIANGRRMPTLTEIAAEGAESEEIAGAEDLNTPESEFASRQIARAVDRALKELPEDLRAAITLREIEGLAYEEIGRIMNCPIGTVRSRIFRARDAIALELRPHLVKRAEERW